MHGVNGYLVCFPSLPPMLECEFESQLGLEFLGFIMSHFLKLVVRDFLWVLRFPPLLHSLMVLANKMKPNKCDFNSVKLNSWVVPLYHVAHDILHVISVCVSSDLHTIAPWPLARVCWRQLAAQTASFNLITITFYIKVTLCTDKWYRLLVVTVTGSGRGGAYSLWQS